MALPTQSPAAARPASFQGIADLHGIVPALGQWLQSHWLQILVSAAIAAAIGTALYALRGFGKSLNRKERYQGTWLAVMGRTIAKTTSLFIFMVAIRLGATYAQTPLALDRVILFLFTVAWVLQGAIWARELILGAIEHKTSSEHFKGEAILNAMGLIRLLVGVVVFAIAIVVLLDNLGVNVTGLVAGLGVGGIAIGLAAQGIFADLFAALAIIFDRPFGKGDGVSVDGNFGVIEDIGLKSTRIRMYTGELLVLSNKNLLDKMIVNLAGRQKIRTKYTIGVAYETPPDVLERLPGMLREIVESLDAECARAGFEAFGGSSLDHTVFIDTPGGDWAVAHATRDRFLVAVMRKFAEEGITIAYPTQTMYVAGPDGNVVVPFPQERGEGRQAAE